MKRRWYRSLLQRRVLVMFLLAVQLAMMIYLTVSSGMVSQVVNLSLRVLGVAVAIYVMNREEHPSYRLVWVFVILVLPLFGGLFYLTCVYQASTRRFRKDAVYIDSLCRVEKEYGAMIC